MANQPSVTWLQANTPENWPQISAHDAIQALGAIPARASFALATHAVAATSNRAIAVETELAQFRAAQDGTNAGIQQHLTQMNTDVQGLLQRLQQAEQQIQQLLQAQAAPAPAVPVQVPPQPPQPQAPPAAAPPKVKFPEPSDYLGDRAQFSAFASQVRSYLIGMGHAYVTDRQKSLYTLQKVRGTAYNHVQAWVDSAGTANEVAEVTNWTTCMDSLKAIFGPLDEEGDARRTLKALRHRTTVDAYAAEFRRLGALTGFAENVLCSMFEEGLKQEIRERFVGRPKATTLAGWINDAATIERDLAQLRGGTRPQRAATTNTPTSSHAPRDPNAMEIDKTSAAERQRRRTEHLCFYCGGADHQNRNCPLKAAGKGPSGRAAVASEGTPPVEAATMPPVPALSAAPNAVATPPAPAPLEANVLQDPFAAWATFMRQHAPPTGSAARPQGF